MWTLPQIVKIQNGTKCNTIYKSPSGSIIIGSMPLFIMRSPPSWNKCPFGPLLLKTFIVELSLKLTIWDLSQILQVSLRGSHLPIGRYVLGLHTSVRTVRLQPASLRWHGNWNLLGDGLPVCGNHGLLREILEASAACIIAHFRNGTAQSDVSGDVCILIHWEVFFHNIC